MKLDVASVEVNGPEEVNRRTLFKNYALPKEHGHLFVVFLYFDWLFVSAFQSRVTHSLGLPAAPYIAKYGLEL